MISRSLAVPLEAVDGLQERNWGKFTGKPWNEIKILLDPMTFHERYHYVPPSGESWEAFEFRLVSVIQSLARDHADEIVVVITHGGTIRALMPFLLGVPKEESFKCDPDNASMTIVDLDANGFNQVIVNDTSHLSSK